MFLIIYAIFIALVFTFILTVNQKNKSTSKPTTIKPTSYSRTGHEDHTRPLSHNSHASFKRNNEKDTIKDPPLSEAERNVLRGK